MIQFVIYANTVIYIILAILKLINLSSLNQALITKTISSSTFNIQVLNV